MTDRDGDVIKLRDLPAETFTEANTSEQSVNKARVGDIVLYTLTGYNADSINKRRNDADADREQHRERSDGSQLHIGAAVTAGDVFPMIVCKSWRGRVSGQVILEGNDSYWTAATPGHGPGKYHFRNDDALLSPTSRPDALMDIGGAVTALRAGKRVARTTWRTGMFLVLNPATPIRVHSSLPLGKAAPELVNTEINHLGVIHKVYPNREVMPWAASHAALLAEDWIILDEGN